MYIHIPSGMRSGRRCCKCGTGKNVAWIDDYTNCYCTDCKIKLQDDIGRNNYNEAGT